MNAVSYLLSEYVPFDHLEKIDLAKFRDFVAKFQERIYDYVPGQPVITASAVVVNPDFTKILLTHHKLHKFYRQFGGHAEGESDLEKVVIDELSDESGATGNLLIKNPFDLIRWNFPDRTKDNIFYPAHDCFDIAFLFMIRETEQLRPNKKEVLDTKWELLETWRDYSPANNPVYAKNPQNFDYQQRICKKIKLFTRGRINKDNKKSDRWHLRQPGRFRAIGI